MPANTTEMIDYPTAENIKYSRASCINFSFCLFIFFVRRRRRRRTTATMATVRSLLLCVYAVIVIVLFIVVGDGTVFLFVLLSRPLLLQMLLFAIDVLVGAHGIASAS